MVLSDDNKIIHGLWIGNRLSTLELLTLHSFTEHGHEFHLWTYEPLLNDLPANVVIRDANEIIPEAEIFRKKEDDPVFKIGKGSIGAPFSDLFRYRLLYEHGGWWVDMDVTCVKPFNVETPYFFRAHPLLPVIGNIIKVPPRSELMRLTHEEAKATCNADTAEWLLPNKILNKHIEALGLSGFTRNDLSARDWWEEVEVFIQTGRKFPEKWLFIHWMNENWRSQQLDKNLFYQGTTIGKLCEKHGFEVYKYPFFKKMRALWKHL